MSMPEQVAVPLRPELSELPDRIKELPVDARGYPVPWFVGWVDGQPEFRVADGRKWAQAVQNKLCWVCGRRLGTYRVFVLGPMCVMTGTTSEPPCHLDCARWSACNCPFLVRPHMVRRENDMPEEAQPAAGCGLPRNPGVTALYICRGYRLFQDDNGRPLIRVGRPPEAVEWFAEGRLATRAEILASVDSGLPLLLEVDSSPEAKAELEKRREELVRDLLPAS